MSERRFDAGGGDARSDAPRVIQRDVPPASRLRDLIRESDCTYESLIRSVRCVAHEAGDRRFNANRSSVAQWVAGSNPAPRTRSYLAEAFSRRLGRRITVADLGFPAAEEEHVGLDLDDPVRTVADLASADLARRPFLRSAAYSVLSVAVALSYRGAARPAQAAAATNHPVRVGRSDVDAVRRLTAAFAAADEQLGGRHGRAAVVTYLSQDVSALCRGVFTDEAVRSAMFSAAAETAYLCGWKAHDAGRESLAQRYYLQAFGLAAEADRVSGQAHASYVLRILAHHALDIGRPDRCVDLTEAAWDRARGKLDPHTSSLLALTRARAYAADRQRRRSLAWLRRAEDLAAADYAGDSPRWARLNGSTAARVNSQSAKVWTVLGNHATAESLHARAVARWDPGSHPRVRALALSWLASTQVAQGHIEQACGTWSEAIPGLRSVRSARSERALATIRATLDSPRYRTLPTAREVLTALA
ncbi:MAG: hypothetical protein ACRCYQ_13190 [Nocardioides sp.]